MDYGESRLSRFAAGVQEACWLAAAITVPLLMNPRGADLVFQPFKFGVLVLLALIGSAAWIVRASCPPADGLPGKWRRPGVWPLALMATAGAALISALLSVDRVASLRGAVETAQGFPSVAAGLALAALVGFNLRSPAQWRRLSTAIITTGFAVAMMAVLQRYGLDPAHPDLAGIRVFSTAGHPIYLGGYLLMVIPFTLARLLACRHLPVRQRWIEGTLLAAILAVQLAGFVCAESRGPALGLAAALFTFASLSVVRSGISSRTALAVVACVAATGIAFGFLSQGTDLPIVKRFLKLKSADQGVEVYRSGIWKQMPSMMVPDKPFLRSPDATPDPLQFSRALVGYGPETLQELLPQREAWRGSSIIENRFHNLVWDHGFSFGLAGLAGLLALFHLAVQQGGEVLGLIACRRDKWNHRVITLLVSTAAAAGAGILLGPGFAGMGLLVGFASSVPILALARLRGIRPRNGDPESASPELAGAVVAMVAALAGHLVDMAFIFPTGPTAVMCCLTVGAIHAARRMARENSATPEVRALELDSSARRSGEGPLLALASITLVFVLTHQYSYQALSLGALLEWSFFNPAGSDGRKSWLWMVPATHFLVGIALVAVGTARAPGRFHVKPWLLLAGGTGLAAFTYLLFHGSRIVAIGPVPASSAPLATITRQAEDYEGLFSAYLGIALITLLVAGWRLAPLSSAGPRPATPLPWAIAGLAVVAAFAAGHHLVLVPLRANLANQWGSALSALGRPDHAIEMFRRAVWLDPRPFALRNMLAASLVAKSDSTQDLAAATRLLEEAEQAVAPPLALSGSTRANFHLGVILLRRALAEPRPARDTTARRAEEAFARALALEPHQEEVWSYASIVDRLLLDDAAAAGLKLAHAMSLPNSAPDVSSARYAALASSAPDTRLRAEFARIAAPHFDRLIALNSGPAAAKARMEKAGLMAAHRGDPAEIEALLRAALPEAPTEFDWQVKSMLAELLLQQRRIPEARALLLDALRSAPEPMRKRFSIVLTQLGNGP